MVTTGHDRPMSSGFLQMPLELRQKVYRPLLLVHPYVTIKRKGYNLEPAILRISKQIHEEASHVLCQHNTWIILATDKPLEIQNSNPTLFPAWTTQQRFPLLPLTGNGFPSKVPLTVKLLLPSSPELKNPRRYIVSAYGFDHICQNLTMFPKKSGLDLSLNFANTKSETLHYVMDRLEEVCGFERIPVMGLDERDAQDVLERLIVTASSTRRGAAKRILYYRNRDAEYQSQGDLLKAMRTCQEGMEYTGWLYPNVLDLEAGWMPDDFHDVDGWRDLGLSIEPFTEMALMLARCSLDYGDPQSTRQIMTCFLGSLAYSQYDHADPKVAQGQYILAIALATEGAANAAAYSFLQALGLGYDADCIYKEIDAMKTRLEQRGTDPDANLAK